MAPFPNDRSTDTPPDEDQAPLLGHVASSVMHSVINRITAVVSQGEMLKARRLSQDEIAHKADAIIRAALEGATLARRFAEYCRNGVAPDATTVDLDALIAARVEARREDAPAGVELVADLGARSSFIGDPDRLGIMLDCLIDNAFEALTAGSRGGIVTISTRLDPQGWLELDVRDDGPGMCPEVMEQALEPFFTTRPGHQGLGLPLARSLWRRHRGAFSIDAPPGQGTLVRLTRPPSEPPAGA